MSNNCLGSLAGSIDVWQLQRPELNYRHYVDPFCLEPMSRFTGDLINRQMVNVDLSLIKVEYYNSYYSLNLYPAQEEVVLTRICIDHSRLTHSYLLKREDQPLCISCNEPFMVKHILIDCIGFSYVRRQFFQTNDLRYLFQNVPADNMLIFLKHIYLFNKI